MNNNDLKVTITRTFNSILKGNLKKSLSRPAKMISSLDQKWYMEVIKKYGFKLISLSLHSITPKIHARVQLFHSFGRYLMVMSKKHGMTYTVKYLKACQLAIQKSIAGQPLASLRELEPDLPLPRLTKSGLPVIIKTKDRTAIRGGASAVIRMWLSIFAIYRVIDAPLNPKLGTITDPFSGDVAYLKELIRYIPKGMKVFEVFEKRVTPPVQGLANQGLQPILKSAPGAKVSMAEYLVLPKLLKAKGMWDVLVRYNEVRGNWVLLTQMYELERLGKRATEIFGEPSKYLESIGRLAFKKEPAGKLRVFAIVDGITQSTLKVFHDWVFSLLRKLPNDGTFNQEAAFDRAIEKAKASGCAFGYDLSSATDRLPLSLQVGIVEYWFGSEEAELWRKILVDRDYLVRETAKDEYGIEPGLYRYAVGQPMGAYSSWAMLAITHHFIVQWAYFLTHPVSRAQRGRAQWWTGYEVLGDDIVIFDKAVAKKYLEIMASLGVGINLNKSVVSDPGRVVEFAKRTGLGTQDVSAISLKMIMAVKGIKEMTEVSLYLALKTGLSISNYFSALNALGPSLLYKGKVSISRYTNALSRILLRLVKKDGSNLRNVLALFIDTDRPEVWFNHETLCITPGKAQHLVQKLVAGQVAELVPTVPQFIYYHDQAVLVRDSLVITIANKVWKYLNRGVEVADTKLKVSAKHSIIAHYSRVLLYPWAIAVPIESVESEDTRYMPQSGSTEVKLLHPFEFISKQSETEQLVADKFLQEVDNFIWKVWVGSELLSRLIPINDLLDAGILLREDVYYRSGSPDIPWWALEALLEELSDAGNLIDIDLPELYKIDQLITGYLSLIQHSKFAVDKMSGILKHEIPEASVETYNLNLLHDLSSRMKKLGKIKDYVYYARTQQDKGLFRKRPDNYEVFHDIVA